MSTLAQHIDELKGLVPINRLPGTRQQSVIDNCILQEFAPGAVVYSQGDDDDDLYYLIEGTVSLHWRGDKLKQITSGSAAAKRAFDRPGKKRHSIVAETQTTIALFPSFIVEQEMRNARLVSDKSSLEVSDIASEKSSNWMIRMLQSSLFSQLPATNIQNIFARMERYEVKADQAVIQQGEPGDYYYVIERGYCEVTRKRAGKKRDVHLADLKPGDAFGEEALIADATRGATVRMLDDGVLMRLPKDEFKTLIQTPLLKPVGIEDAINSIRQETRWIDIRYPEQFQAMPMAYSENIPFNMIRLQAGRLDKEYEYIVCSDSREQSAVAAFLLLERGVTVRYLESPVEEVYPRLPEALRAIKPSIEVSPTIGEQYDRQEGVESSGYLSTKKPMSDLPETGKSARVGEEFVDSSSNRVAQRGQYNNGLSNKGQSDKEEEFAVSSDEAVQRLENTIEKIDRVYIDKERELESQRKLSPDAYAHTATGRRLADLIDDMEHSQGLLNNGTTGAEDELPTHNQLDMDVTGGQQQVEHLSETANPNILLVNTSVPLPVDVDLANDDVGELNLNDDALSMMIRDFEKRIRNQVAGELSQRTAKLQARYQHKLGRVQRAAAIEVKKRQVAYKEKVDLHYKKKELSLRKHYQKLMALANRVTAQKAQLEDAKLQFEDKLQAANALYKEVEAMRSSLKEHLTAEIEMNAAAQRRHRHDDVSS